MIIRSKAPLRLGLAGGGTDVAPYCSEYGGFVLNATIDMYAYCSIEVTNDNEIIFEATDRDEIFKSKSREPLIIDGLLDLHKGVYNRIVKDFNNDRALSLKMTTYSDAPAGSGLGSSSTMVVAIIKAYVEWLDLPLGEYDISRLAYGIEREDIGLSGGKQDQYSATFGGFNFMEFYEKNRVVVNPLRIKNWIIDELESSIVLYYTGSSRESAKIIDEQVRKVEEKDEGSLNATHIVKQDALIMKEAILKGDIKLLSDTMNHSWLFKKKMAPSISNKLIDDVFRIAINSGAYSGKISGAGGGGFIIFLINPIKRMSVVNALNALSGKVVNFNFTKYGAKGWRIYE
jgi:D-glycero-alpha-D-manno-heptose-7-phosphate kinase